MPRIKPEPDPKPYPNPRKRKDGGKLLPRELLQLPKRLRPTKPKGPSGSRKPVAPMQKRPIPKPGPSPRKPGIGAVPRPAKPNTGSGKGKVPRPAKPGTGSGKGKVPKPMPYKPKKTVDPKIKNSPAYKMYMQNKLRRKM